MTPSASTISEPPTRRDFFISYAGEDEHHAQWIASWLDAHGRTYVFARDDFRAGADFIQEMNQALETCDRVIAVLTSQYFDGQFAVMEWRAAFAAGVLTPVRMETCELPPLYRTTIYVDLVGLDGSARDQVLHRAFGVDGRARLVGPPARTRPREALAPFWNVPIERNPNFTGRDSVLKTLHSDLMSGRPAAVTQAIRGLGGIGKTQLATEYAYRHAYDYDIVWWIRSEDAETRRGDMLKLALAVLSASALAEASDDEAALGLLRTWLDSNGGWLLIFDNVERPADILDLIPMARSGHVIITSRHQAWGRVAKPVELQVWSQDEGTEYLVARARVGDRRLAGKLAELLGGLPLALEQAASYIERTGIGVGEYISLFEQHELELFRGEGAQGAERTVETVWDVSLGKLELESPAGVELLRFCAFLLPDRIPKDLLVQHADALPDLLAEVVRDRRSFNETIAALRQYSLLQTTETTLSMHRLVQSVIRERTPNEMYRSLNEAAQDIRTEMLRSEGGIERDDGPLPAAALDQPFDERIQTEGLDVAEPRVRRFRLGRRRRMMSAFVAAVLLAAGSWFSPHTSEITSRTWDRSIPKIVSRSGALDPSIQPGDLIRLGTRDGREGESVVCCVVYRPGSTDRYLLSVPIVLGDRFTVGSPVWRVFGADGTEPVATLTDWTRQSSGRGFVNQALAFLARLDLGTVDPVFPNGSVIRGVVWLTGTGMLLRVLGNSDEYTLHDMSFRTVLTLGGQPYGFRDLILAKSGAGAATARIGRTGSAVIDENGMLVGMLLAHSEIGALVMPIHAVFTLLGVELVLPPPFEIREAAVDILARTLWGEARTEGVAGMQAVAAVVVNRLQANAAFYGSTVESVCQKAHQFSSWNLGDPHRHRMLTVDSTDSDFAAALEVATHTLDGVLVDPTGGATHYHSTELVSPPRWASGARITRVIGRHQFYDLQNPSGQ